MIKFVVGVDSLAEFAELQRHALIDYHGQLVVPCWTRFQPKQADEILREGGSIYRVIKNRIECRHRILGFEMVDTEEKGRMCMIMQDAEIIKTVSTPRRPFQGWRYLKPSDVPKDIGPYDPANDQDIPPEMEEALRESGLI